MRARSRERLQRSSWLSGRTRAAHTSSKACSNLLHGGETIGEGPVAEQRTDERGADDDAVGIAAHLGGLLGLGDPEADADTLAPAARVSATSCSARSPTVARSPVTPIVDAAYTKPREASDVDASRAGDELGATRKTLSRSKASAAAIHSPASSGTRSGVMSPAPPAAARSRAKASTP